MPRLLKITILLSAIFSTLMLAGCSRGPDINTARPAIEKTFTQLMNYWNEGDFSEFIALVNKTGFLPDPEQHITQLEQLQEKLGSITQLGTILITDKPEDKAAFMVVVSVMTTQRGVMRLTLAYNPKLDIIGYHVDSQVAGSID
jgi:hypothetical protein